MKQLTIRGVSNDLHRSLKNKAARRGVSINRYVLAILREAVGLSDSFSNGEVEYDDLDHLMGTWSEEDYRAFEQQLAQQRAIDGELWPT